MFFNEIPSEQVPWFVGLGVLVLVFRLIFLPFLGPRIKEKTGYSTQTITAVSSLVMVFFIFFVIFFLM